MGALFTPGTWAPWVFGPRRESVALVVTCPQCRKSLSIGGAEHGSCHTIAPDGGVAPSVVCPHCGWHVFLRLEAWNARA